MTKQDIEKIRAVAYRKKNPNDLTIAEAIEILLTSDGKGRAYKNRALKRLIKLNTIEVLNKCVESLGNVNIMRETLMED